MASLKQIRRGSRLSLVLGTLIAAVLFAAVAYANEDPVATCPTTGNETVATDQSDYAPGSVVYITGDGYAASCDVVVRVTRPDGSVVRGDGSSTPGSDSVTTGESGDLAYDYQLNAMKGEYLVEVLGADAMLATTTFTDALSFDQNNVDLSPVWVPKPTSTTATTRTYSLLVEQDSPDTAIKCIKMLAPTSGWQINSVTMAASSAGTWNSGTILNNSAKFVDATGTGLPGGASGFARIEINATTPTTNGSGTWQISVGTSGTNAVADQGCAVTASSQSIVTFWNNAWPNGTNRIYTADFRDAGGAVTTPTVAIGSPATYRIRVSLTGTTTAPNGDDRMSYATIALPPCFGAISVTNPPTVFSPSTTRTWTASSLDNVIRLRANAATTDPLVDENP